MRSLIGMTHRLVFVCSLVALAVPRITSATDDLPDPTRPYVKRERPALVTRAVSAPEHSLVLQSTLVSPGRKLAVINGKIYRIGERVGDANILDIQPHLVIVAREGGRQSVRMLPQAQGMHRYVSSRRNNE